MYKCIPVFQFLALASQKSTEVLATSFTSFTDMIKTNVILYRNLGKFAKGDLFKSKSTTEYPPNESDVKFQCTKG